MSRFAIWLLPGILAFVATVLLAVRLAFPYIDLYKDELLAQVARAFDAEISISAIKTELRGYHPVIELVDVKISNAEHKNDLQFSSLRVEFDLFASLRQGAPIIRETYLKNGVLTVTRDTEGKIHTLVPLSSGMEQQDFSVRIQNVTLSWKDLLQQQDYTFHDVNLGVDAKQGRWHITLTSRLPEELGERLSLAANFSGHLNQPASWQGYFNLDTENLNLAAWRTLFGLEEHYSGILSLAARGEVDQQQVIWVNGKVECHQCSELPGEAGESLNLSTDFAWDDGTDFEKFALLDMTLKTSALELKDMDIIGVRQQHQKLLSLALRLPELQQNQLDGLAQHLNPEVVVLPFMAESGAVSLSLSLPTPSVRGWKAWRQQLQDLKHYDLTQVQSADLSITLEDGLIRLPDYFANDIGYDEITVSARFAQKDGTRVLLADDFFVRIADATLRGHAGWFESLDENAAIAVTVDAADVPLTAIPAWLPSTKLNPKFADWLENAFIQGTLVQGRLEIAGDVEAFPFVNNRGDFFWSASIRDMKMNYRSQREPLTQVDADVVFNKRTFMASVSKLRYYDMYSDEVDVRIDDVQSPFVEIHGSMEGPLADVFTYVKQARLVDADSFLIRNIQFGGDSRITLDIGAGLSKQVTTPLKVQGTLQFKQSDFSVPALDIDLNKINGNLAFDRSGGNSELLEMFWNGKQLSGSARALGDSTLLSFTGDFSVAELAEILTHEPVNLGDGSSNWHIDVMVPNLKPQQVATDLFSVKLQSDLEGTALHLPPPFEKKSTGRQSVALTVITEEAGSEYQFIYTGIVQGWLQPRDTGYSGQVHFGRQPLPPQTEAGILISGQLEQAVAVDDWFNLAADGDGMLVRDIAEVELIFSDLLLGEDSLGRVAVNSRQVNEGHWQWSLDSADIAGEIILSNRDDVIEMRANMDRLLLRKRGMLQVFNDNDGSVSLPKSEILVQQFQYGDIEGEDLVLLLSPLEEGTSVDRLRMQIGDITLISEGQWQQSNTGVRSIFDISISGEDYGSFFHAWNISRDFAQGKGRLSGRLSWPGPPADLDFEQVRGDIRLDLKDGVIKKVEPGIGRLLGLMNVGMIVRRLSLDFQDVFRQGLTFDNMTADFEFSAGSMYTKNFFLTGPSMKVSLQGRTGIVARDYDQQVEVMPNLSSSLPLASALIGGPLAGVSVYLLDKLTNFGDSIDNAVILKYQVRGSWDEPEVKFVESKIAEHIKGPLRPLIEKMTPR